MKPIGEQIKDFFEGKAEKGERAPFTGPTKAVRVTRKSLGRVRGARNSAYAKHANSLSRERLRKHFAQMDRMLETKGRRQHG